MGMPSYYQTGFRQPPVGHQLGRNALRRHQQYRQQCPVHRRRFPQPDQILRHRAELCLRPGPQRSESRALPNASTELSQQRQRQHQHNYNSPLPPAQPGPQPAPRQRRRAPRRCRRKPGAQSPQTRLLFIFRQAKPVFRVVRLHRPSRPPSPESTWKPKFVGKNPFILRQTCPERSRRPLDERISPAHPSGGTPFALSSPRSGRVEGFSRRQLRLQG